MVDFNGQNSWSSRKKSMFDPEKTAWSIRRKISWSITFCSKDSGRNRATDLCNNLILQSQIVGALKIVHDWRLSIIFDILAFFGPEWAITLFCCLCIQNYKLSSHNETSHNCCHVSPIFTITFYPMSVVYLICINWSRGLSVIKHRCSD